ncbi:non-canonical purine NTP pyrophosphatase [Myxococcota bacterium]|nr:non-canonical purine NTP pyrophosphatase [Myxococcota bacterium]MBU1430879.1 non-canonical purine NTP pyrophosphatase [Myxococcota bacterium]MBU1898767.1 non-canonical purine NTP pyrophosphatase [Myxococcota bacterium]
MIVLATGNAHKLQEFQGLLPGVALRRLSDFPGAPDPIEDAPDFAGNAMIKARSAWAHTGQIALADDSGLEVEALGWGPGVYSARYAPGSDADRVTKLLSALQGVTARRARFTCVIAVCGLPPELPLAEGLRRDGDCVLAVGQVYGEIAHTPTGEGGFGYDPVFLRPDGRSLASLRPEEKDAVSHRGRAARAILPLLQSIS